VAARRNSFIWRAHRPALIRIVPIQGCVFEMREEHLNFLSQPHSRSHTAWSWQYRGRPAGASSWFLRGCDLAGIQLVGSNFIFDGQGLAGVFRAWYLRRPACCSCSDQKYCAGELLSGSLRGRCYWLSQFHSKIGRRHVPSVRHLLCPARGIWGLMLRPRAIQGIGALTRRPHLR